MRCSFTDFKHHRANAQLAFAKDERGAPGIIFALAAVPILLLIGMAIDSTRASAIKSKIQLGLDKAVIAGARKLAITGSAAEASRAARQRFAATEAAVFEPELLATANQSSGLVSVTARYTMETTFLSLVGYPELAMTAKSSASTRKDKPATEGNATPPAPKADLARALSSLSESDIDRLIGQVSDACYRLRDYRLDANVPQCGSVFQGTFDKEFRNALATNANAAALLPSGVRLVD